MNNRYKRLFDSDKAEGEFWPSFTDMLAAILLVMLLILTVYIDRVFADYREQKAEADALRVEVEQLRGVREELVQELLTAFKDKGLEVSVDEKTGDIQFTTDVLFDFDSDQLSESFKKDLKEFIPLYFSILYGEKYRDYIAEVIIEGHTDDEGSYLTNLDLSQRRAYSVVRYIISDEFGDFDNKQHVVKSITANGRSYSHPILVPGTTEVDDDKSRRVEIKYRFVNIIDQEE